MSAHVFADGVEVWCDVPGQEGCYQVSDHGRIRSVDRQITEKTGRVKNSRGRILRPAAGASGHLSVVLGRSVGSKQVHALVMLTFKGPYPLGQEVLHLDHNPGNNRFSNLRYGTRSENLQMDYDAGRRCVAKSVNALHINGTSQAFLSTSSAAKALGVTSRCIRRACLRGLALSNCKTRVSYAAIL
jgi:HNH endonuclease/NUMOD4 motif